MPEHDDETFPAWLRRQLKRRDWRQIDLAKRADVSSTSISHYLNGTRVPDPITCDRIADALGADRDLVLALAGHRPPDRPIDPDDPRERVIALIRKAQIDTFRADTLEAVIRDWMRQDALPRP